MMTDPVADLLARIRNAGKAHHPEIVCPSSKLKLAIAKVLSAEGYLGDVRSEQRDGKPVLVMRVRYDGNGRALIAGLRRVSRPGRRVYVASDEIPTVRSGLGVAVLSTSKVRATIALTMASMTKSAR